MATDTPVDTKQDTSKVKEVAARATSAPAATFAALKRKPRRTSKFLITTVDEAGDEITMEMKFQGLSATEYDALVSEHPPTPKEKQLGAVYNVKTFAPALISAVSVQPRLSYDEAKEIYESDEWSSGEIFDLFIRAQQVCNNGVNVPFNGND